MNTRYLIPGTLKQGYLTKAPPLNRGSWTTAFKGWKKRWCILYESGHELFLQYYDDEESARGNSAPKSNVSLKCCSKVDVDLQHSSYKNVFAIHLPERIYYFSSSSHYEMTEWSDTICNYLQLEQKEENHQPRASFGTMPGPPSPRLYHPTPHQPTPDSSSVYSVYSLSTPFELGTQTLPPTSSASLPNSLYSTYSTNNRVQLRSLPAPPPEDTNIQQRSLPAPPVENQMVHTSNRSLPPPPSADDEEVFEQMAPLAPPRARSPERRAMTPPPPLPPPYGGHINVPVPAPRRILSEKPEVPPVPPPRFASSTLPQVVPNTYITNTASR